MKLRRRKGSILILAMFMLTVVVLFAGLFLQMTLLNLMHINKNIESQRAAWIARAGISQQIHDLREYWYLHQQEVREGTFGGGSYKVGTASLIGRGFHKALVVCVGQYPTDSEEKDISKIKKVCEAAEISMNAPSDYLLYIQPKAASVSISNSFYGPIHINGDANMGSAWNGGTFFKSNSDYGPSISAAGHFYIQNDTYNATFKFGEGTFTTVSSVGATPTFTATTSFTTKAAGVPKWTNGPYNSIQYPTIVEREAADGSTFSYNLMEDKVSGSVNFKNIPKMSEVNYDKFKYLIPDDWHITADDPKGQKVVWRANENIGGGWLSGTSMSRAAVGKLIGAVPWGFGTFQVDIPDSRDMKYVRHLYMEYKDPLALAADKGIYGLGVGQKGGILSYTIDRVNRKFNIKYPIMWHYYRFLYPPGQGGAPGGFIRGWNRVEEDKSSGGGANATVSVTAVNTPVVTDPDFTGMFIVWVKAGATAYDSNSNPAELWTETTSITAAGAADKKFEADYTTGTLTFGSCVGGIGVKGGYALPAPCQLRIAYTYARDFQSSYFYLSTDATVKCVELDLGTINEDNCPRDPKYPDDKKKYGVIYSELPLIVWGVPKVPVTIICDNDVYLGPVNTDYLNPNDIENVKGYIKTGLVQDDPRANPVGIICTKVLWYDHTFAKWESDAAEGYSFMNIGTRQNPVTYAYILKNWIINKVAFFASFIMSYAPGTHYFEDEFGTLETGASTRLYEIGPGKWRSSFWHYYPPRKIIGTIYKDCEQGAITAFSGGNFERIWGASNCPVNYYASTFRTNPPPHLPSYIYLTNWTKIASGEIKTDPETGTEYNKLLGETFIETLDTFIQTEGVGAEYTTEFATFLSEMINVLEGGEIKTGE